MRWTPGVVETVELPQLIRGKTRAAFALSPSGDCLAVARGTLVRLYELPAN